MKLHAMKLATWLIVALAAIAAGTSGVMADPPVQSEEAKREGEAYFEQHVRPLLIQHCTKCHGAEKQESGLRLDSRAAAEKGGDGGPMFVPGNPDASRLIRLVRYNEDVQMPPEGKLPNEQIAKLTEWVGRGAPWPEEKAEGETGKADVRRVGVSDPHGHWAFQPVVAPPVPLVKAPDWVQTPVDNFVLAKLEAKGLSPGTPADRRTLIRRVTFDLIGLPPSFEEVEAFVNDDSADAYSRLVERLLASSHYGERWGRHWLDVARYADTKGYVGVDKGDIERRNYPFAYSYRDWVIKAINDDLPYDQFLLQQIAADKLPLGDDKTALAALGFFRVGRVFLNNKNDQIDDKIDVLMRGTQALTVACARCHDHKFDPIPTADYYSLYGVFASTDEPDDAANERMLLADIEHPYNVRVFKRGNQGTQGDEAPRQFLAALSGPDRRPFTQGSGRLELAHAIASRENPLTARVLVNRVWANHFGEGIVPTTSDFGIRTQPPVHRELLDYLADHFSAEGWSLKNLHRWIVLSSTYRQSSHLRPECAAVDSENRLLWRVNRRRLDFEQMRDAMLEVSGELDYSKGGPGVELTKEPFSRRRTVYGRVDRQNLPGMFRTFDFANPDTHSAGRFQTTVPQQGLFVFNHPFVLERARGVASRVNAEMTEDPRAIVARMYELVLARQPSEDDLAKATAFIATGGPNEHPITTKVGVWQQLAQALLMTNEFMFVD